MAVARIERHKAALVGIWIALTVGSAGFAADDPKSDPFAVRRKALIIEAFSRHIEWPEEALPQDATFFVCLQGRGPSVDGLLQQLRQNLHKHRLKNRPTAIVHLKATDSLKRCHILFLGASESGRLKERLATVADRPIVTIGDTAGFAERGLHINFFQRIGPPPAHRRYMAYELNVSAIKRSSQKLSFGGAILSQGRAVKSTAEGTNK